MLQKLEGHNADIYEKNNQGFNFSKLSKFKFF